MAAIGVVVGGSLAFWLADSGSDTTIVRNGEIWLQGEVSQTMSPPSEGGCSITVNGYEVTVAYGADVVPPPTPGTVTGLSACTDQTGRQADVYAQIVRPHVASIFSSPKYYARISGWTRTVDMIVLALDAGAVIYVGIRLSKRWPRAPVNGSDLTRSPGG